MQDDSELLRHYSSGNSDEAFAELVSRHIGPVYAVALRRVGGDAHLADDVTQEVFADLARKAASVAGRESVVGWLFIAARFCAAKKVRREHQRRTVWQKARHMTELDDHPAREPDWDGIRPVLDEAIHSLGRRDREAILLYFFDKRTFGDLGAKLRLSESGARMRVERALVKLRLSLGRYGITSTTTALTIVLGSQAAAAVPASLATSVTTAALAGAHSGGGALLLLMSITKTQLGAAMAVVLVGASIMGVVQHRQITALQAERTSAFNESAASGRRANELAGRLAADEAALARVKTQLSTQQSGGGNMSANNPPPGVKVIHMKDVIRDHPEYAALLRKDLRRNVVREYSRAIAALSLPPDKAIQLKELLVESGMTSYDAEDAVSQSGLDPNSAEARKAVSEATKDSDQAIKSLIGSDANEKLHALEGTGNFGSQNGIDDYAVDMADAGVSLSAEQSQALAQSLHDLSNPDKNPDASSPGYKDADPATWQSPLDQQFFASAATILTPAQLKILKLSRSENTQRSAIMKEYTGNAFAVIIN